MRPNVVLITGATGLVGGALLRRLLERDPQLQARVLVRDPERWLRALAELRVPVSRVTAIAGDVTRPGLGLPAGVRRELAREVSLVVHAAADTVFSRPLSIARAVNRDGTRHVAELASGFPSLERFVYVSTAFVAGRMTGDIVELEHDGTAGFVNAYEQSKHEAECVVRESGLPAVIARPSTIVCESERGIVRQVNAVHRALALQHAGLASMLPGVATSGVELVTTSFVAESLARLCAAPAAIGGTFHLCAGDGAIRLGDLIERAHAVWSRSDAWRRRGIALPALADLETYRLFEQTVLETGDARLRRITRALSHFAPQLGLPKRFDTTHAVEVTGVVATPVVAWIDRLLEWVGSRRGTDGPLSLAVNA